jgi:hypothetical protein
MVPGPLQALGSVMQVVPHSVPPNRHVEEWRLAMVAGPPHLHLIDHLSYDVCGMDPAVSDTHY